MNKDALECWHLALVLWRIGALPLPALCNSSLQLLGGTPVDDKLFLISESERSDGRREDIEEAAHEIERKLRLRAPSETEAAMLALDCVIVAFVDGSTTLERAARETMGVFATFFDKGPLEEPPASLVLAADEDDDLVDRVLVEERFSAAARDFIATAQLSPLGQDSVGR